MTEFKIGAGTSEDQLQQFFAYQFAQATTGTATTGVLSGLAVTQTTTASASVLIGGGLAVSQSSLTAGVDPLVSNSTKTLDVLTANPMGAVARNDLVVFNPASAAIELVVGTPNVTPTDPTPPTGAVLLARLAHLASASTVPTSRITDLRTITYPFGGPYVRATPAKAGKRTHWGYTSVSTTGASATATVTHGAGFTPSAVIIQGVDVTWRIMVDSFTSTTFRVRTFNSAGASYALSGVTIAYFCGE